MPINSTLYSIGHGQKTQEEFISELKSFDIQFLVDVRSSPYSKWVPYFNQGVIEKWLGINGIRYAYMGNYIGGRPINDSCYDEQGYFDYMKMANVPDFEIGIRRLVNANEKQCRVAIMCSESDPSECHRSKLIGRELYFTYGLRMNHIVGINKCVSQDDIMLLLTKKAWNPDGNLFGPCEPPYFKSRKAYKNTSEIENELEEINPYD